MERLQALYQAEQLEETLNNRASMPGVVIERTRFLQEEGIGVHEYLTLKDMRNQAASPKPATESGQKIKEDITKERIERIKRELSGQRTHFSGRDFEG